MNLRPSSLPILRQSPKFVSGETSFSQEGTDRHKALHSHFCGDDSLLNLFGDEDAEGIRWAADYIRLKAPLSDHPLEWEKPGTLIFEDFSEMHGTRDAVCGSDIFDFKWRERDYDPQIVAYGLMRLQELNVNSGVRVHILFGQSKRAVVLDIDAESGWKLINGILREINEAVECRPSEYCGWCANRLACETLNKRAQAVLAGRADWELEQYHASEIKKPEEMAKALTLWRQLKKWGEAVEHFALEMTIKEGIKIPGYTLKQKNGKRFCFDVQSAFTATGLESADFLKCCDVRFATSKTNPNKAGLENIYHKAKGLPSLAAAKRELKSKLADFVKTSDGSQYLAPEKSTETSSDEE